MELNKNIVDRIRELANAKGHSLTTLESSLGLGNGTISRWKSNSPNTDKLCKVADYFGVSVDYLLGRSENAYCHLDKKTQHMIASLQREMLSNVLSVREKNGVMHKRKLTDAQLKALLAILQQIPESTRKNIKGEQE